MMMLGVTWFFVVVWGMILRCVDVGCVKTSFSRRVGAKISVVTGGWTRDLKREWSRCLPRRMKERSFAPDVLADV